MKLPIGAHQKRQNILQLLYFCAKIRCCVGLFFPVKQRKRYKINIQPVIGTMRLLVEEQNIFPEAASRFHNYRHTYATRAIERGMQTKVLQKLLGHASIRTTMDRYVHMTDDSLTKAVQQLERLFALMV